MKIYSKVIAMVKSVCALSRKVQQHDPDLARQMRRACTSVALNMLEGGMRVRATGWLGSVLR